MPKAELHLHLRGAMPPEFFSGLVEKHPPESVLGDVSSRFLEIFNRYDNIRPFLKSPIAVPAQALFHYCSFEQFLATYLFTSCFFRTATDFRNLIKAVRSELTSQNIVYAEITVSLIEYLNQGITMEELTLALDETIVEPGVEVMWIADLVRNTGALKTLETLDKLLACRPRSLVGITLGGNEHQFPPAQFKSLYGRAREEGLHLSIHAGEALGPHSVWDALEILRVGRIGHGIRSIEDPKLMAYLADHKIPLEICPTSNIQTQVCGNYKDHPLPSLHEAGVPISLNTDDPTFFHTTLVDECFHARAMGISEKDVVAILAGGFKHSFMPRDRKIVFLQQFENYCSQHGFLD